MSQEQRIISNLLDQVDDLKAGGTHPHVQRFAEGGYVIVYHAKLSFRAAPIQMLLLDANIPFTMVEPTWGNDRVIDRNAGNHSVFAPPAIRRGNFTLSQTCAIMSFLGQTHGYSVIGLEQSATCLQVILDSADVSSELFACAKDKEAKNKFATADAGGRLGNWFGHLDKIAAKAAAAGKTFLFGNAPTSADFMLLSAFESLDFALGPEKVVAMCPSGLQTWRAAMEARPFYAVYKARAKPNLFASMQA
jgi:glutathione S-transferase